MDTISRFLCDDHHACDAAFGAAEAAVGAGQWEVVAVRFAAFLDALERHLAREEQILFPRFEERTGERAGPTQIMRAEHEQMRELLNRLEGMVQARERDAFLNHCDTLFTLIQQHNLKEEQILYPAADMVLKEERGALLEAMQRISDYRSAPVATTGVG
ncbi:MAG TPA: hemerythrin domain-containing protein [Chromatiales bacterium]|nr:hemerythrin domain-containing protein [Chromatiales bacterium]